MTTDISRVRPVRTRGYWIAVAAVVLISINLRPGATSIGPVLAEILESLGRDASWGGVLAAMPGACFALFGAFSVALAIRVGLSYALWWGMVAAAVGLVLRPWTSDSLTFLGLSALAFAGIAVGNVLLPAYIKRRFPDQVPLLMALYGSLIGAGAALGGLLALPLAQIAPGGWRGSLAVWGIAALLAGVPMLAIAIREGSRKLRNRAHTRGPSLLRSRHAVALGIFFGVQSMHAYTQFGWAAQMFRDGGVGREYAGLLVALLASLGIVTGLVMPILVARVPDLRWVVIALGVLLVVGYLGVLYLPATASWVWAVSLGLAGAAFPLSLSLITARTRDPHVTARLSGFSQTIGYAMAATGPFLVGLMLAGTGGWTIPLWVLIATAAMMVVAGMIASAPGYVDDELAARAS